MEIYPIIINGEKSGELRVWQEGLMTVFDARCPLKDGVLRLSVYGGGAEGYLGVAIPCGSGLRLNKKLSANAMRGFPAAIEYAGAAGAKPPAPITVQPEELPESVDGLLWFSTPQGDLTAFDGRRCLVAIPAEDGGLGGVIRSINGKSYAVFPGHKRRK